VLPFHDEQVLHKIYNQVSQRAGTSAVQASAEGEMEATIPALASLLAVSAACRKCVLEEAVRERDDAERADELGEAREMEDALETSLGGGGGRGLQGRGKEPLGARGRDSGGGSRVGGVGGVGSSLIRSSMGAVQASMNGAEAECQRGRRPLVLIVVDALDIYARKVRARCDKGERWLVLRPR